MLVRTIGVPLMVITEFDLYQSDLAMEVKSRYLTKLHCGEEEVASSLMKEFEHELLDVDDAPLFWLALADIQWDYGRLDNIVKANALALIDAILRCETNENNSMLLNLRNKLLTSPPVQRKITRKRLYRCTWKLGDVYAFQLSCDYAKELKIDGRFLLFHKIGETEYYPGHIIPIVRVKITESFDVPTCEEEISRLPYVQTGFTRYEDRFYPISGDRPFEEQIEERSKHVYECDEFGFLPQYRIKLLNTSKNVIPKNLIYIGNFPHLKTPPKEFVPHVDSNIPGFSWKCLEQVIIERYWGHNYRQFEIYKSISNIELDG